MNASVVKATEKPLVVRQNYQHDCRRVFDAFTSAGALERWFSPHPDIKARVVEFNFHTGGHYRIEFTLPDGMVTVLAGEYQTIDDQRQISLTWCWEAPDPHAGIDTQVTIEFVDHGETTEVIVTHTRLKDAGMKERHNGGWVGTLQRLQAWLEL